MNRQPLYKYTQRRFGDAMLKQGMFLIGTLHAFRKEEEFQLHIGDEHEGVRLYDYRVDHERYRPGEELPKGLQLMFGKHSPAEFSLQNITICSGEQSRNYYMFCVSEVMDRGAMKRMGYDDCIAIRDPDRFFKFLSHRMRHHTTDHGMAKCVYHSRSFDLSGGKAAPNVHPAVLKDPKFEFQREWRYMWEPKSENIRARIIQSRDAARVCERCVF